MALILLIESSTQNCSVALARDGKLLALKEQFSEKYIHAEKLHPFIQEVMNENNLTMKDLDAVAVSAGPGSYTGLRIGIASAKGICFALGIPLISIPGADILAQYARTQLPQFDFVIPMIDARRMEVYLAVYDQSLLKIEEEQAVILDDAYFKRWAGMNVIFVGDGAFKCKNFIAEEKYILQVLPSAPMMSALASHYFQHEKFSDLASFEPFYLKEFVPGIAKKVL